MLLFKVPFTVISPLPTLILSTAALTAASHKEEISGIPSGTATSVLYVNCAVVLSTSCSMLLFSDMILVSPFREYASEMTDGSNILCPLMTVPNPSSIPIILGSPSESSQISQNISETQ